MAIDLVLLAFFSVVIFMLQKEIDRLFLASMESSTKSATFHDQSREFRHEVRNHLNQIKLSIEDHENKIRKLEGKSKPAQDDSLII